MNYKKNQNKSVDGRCLYHLKKGSNKEILFVEDVSMSLDGWFVIIRHINKKNPKYNRESCITRNDVEYWVSCFISDGYSSS